MISRKQRGDHGSIYNKSYKFDVAYLGTITKSIRTNENLGETKKWIETHQNGKKLVAIERSGSVDADTDVFGNACGPAFKPRGRGADVRRTVGGLVPRALLVASLTVCVRGSEPSRSWGKRVVDKNKITDETKIGVRVQSRTVPGAF